MVSHGVERAPRIDPDYAGVTIPPNIAPLNFAVREPGMAYQIQIEGPAGGGFTVRSEQPRIRLPRRRWRELLARARGDSMRWRVAAQQADGTWREYAPVFVRVAPEPIDPVLVYRRLRPLYSKYVEMGIYQRDLESYQERCVLHSRNIGGACLNCHTFRERDPVRFALHTRGSHGPTMLLAADGRVRSVDTRTAFNAAPAAYTAWHPGGQWLAFSVNKLALFYHMRGETRDVFDSASDLVLYRVATDELAADPAIARPDSLENWPAWDPAGRYLYFSRAPASPIAEYAAVRYDLMRVGFDPDSGRLGEPETVLAASAAGFSVTQPRVSPDGRWLVVTGAAYGNFPVYRREADLYMVDLDTGEWRPLESNDEECDSWHSWSSNGRWLVFSSKRRDGLFARPHIAYIDSAGHAARPFVLPQDDAAYYGACIETFNVPELARAPLPWGTYELAVATWDAKATIAAGLDARVAPAAGPSPQQAAPEPYSSGAR